MFFDYEKAVHLLNYFADKDKGVINQMKAIKLVWMAERLHLRMYGRLLVDDSFYAMTYGPVPSCVKNIAYLDDPRSQRHLSKAVQDYASHFLMAETTKKELSSIQEPDMDFFSKNELEILEKVYNEFGHCSQFELAKLAHLYPEWKKHESKLVDIKDREDMDYLDFFCNIDMSTFTSKDLKAFKDIAKSKDFFEEDPERLQTAKEIYLEKVHMYQLQDRK